MYCNSGLLNFSIIREGRVASKRTIRNWHFRNGIGAAGSTNEVANACNRYIVATCVL